MQFDYLQLARMVVAEVIQFPELARLFRDAVPLSGLHHVEKLLKKANQPDYISIDNVRIAARSLIGNLFIDGVLTSQNSLPVPTDDQIREIVHFYMPSILTKRKSIGRRHA